MAQDLTDLEETYLQEQIFSAGENKSPELQELLFHYESREIRELQERAALFQALSAEIKAELAKGNSDEA